MEVERARKFRANQTFFQKTPPSDQLFVALWIAILIFFLIRPITTDTFLMPNFSQSHESSYGFIWPQHEPLASMQEILHKWELR